MGISKSLNLVELVVIAIFLTVCQCQPQLFGNLGDFGNNFSKKRVQETVIAHCPIISKLYTYYYTN